MGEKVDMTLEEIKKALAELKAARDELEKISARTAPTLTSLALVPTLSFGTGNFAARFIEAQAWLNSLLYALSQDEQNLIVGPREAEVGNEVRG